MSGLRDLAAQATPPEHGEDTWEQKMAWDRYNEACSRLDRVMNNPETAVLLADAMDAHAEWADPDAEDSSDTRRLNLLLARYAELDIRAGGEA